MPLRTRLLRSAALLALGVLTWVLLGANVSGCLGPLGRTYVQSIADGCAKPGIGLAVPAGLAFMLAAVVALESPFRHPVRHRLGIAAIAAVVAVGIYVASRPTSLTGPTSTGEVITVALPLDLAMVAVAAMVAGTFGWVASRWIRPQIAGRASG